MPKVTINGNEAARLNELVSELKPSSKEGETVSLTGALTYLLEPAVSKKTLDERVKFKVRREGSQLFIDLWFDDCQLVSRLVVGGDENLVDMVSSGELRLTKDSKLVYPDGSRWFRDEPPVPPFKQRSK